MARQRRVEFDGALYHVMARGDRRDPIVLTDDDKVMLAELIASQTSVPLDWLCENLDMGSRSHCSRLINAQTSQITRQSIPEGTENPPAEKSNIQ